MALKTSLESKYTVVLSGCWEWNRILANGYGQLRIGEKKLCAHRAIYEIHRGPIPQGKHLDHLCRNPRCVNPAHLEPVTCRENIRRGRLTKVDVKTVEEMRKMRALGLTLREISKKLQISQGHISEICRGKYWGDANGPLAPRDRRGLKKQQSR